MECIEAIALKPSFLVKTNSQLFHNDDVWCLAGISNVSSDDFPVEDLLNLDSPQKDVAFSDQQKVAIQTHLNQSSSAAIQFHSLSIADLDLPVDEVENLEWLSQFVDDSALGHSFSLLSSPAAFSKEGGGGLVEPLNRPVHKKPRTKRSRPRGRAWPMAPSPPSVSFAKPAADKQIRKPDGGGGPVSGRRCTHCQVQKTPQWRTGPVGPKSLCNACGVRFKSGRLFPEYRPACSPTFSQKLHSNSHRRVLEMRRLSEAAGAG